jgi:hypothetical protein
VKISFYDVKIRKKVEVDDRNVVKVTFKTKNGQIRYGLRAKTSDGRNLTKFVSKSEWEKMRVPEAK